MAFQLLPLPTKPLIHMTTRLIFQKYKAICANCLKGSDVFLLQQNKIQTSTRPHMICYLLMSLPSSSPAPFFSGSSSLLSSLNTPRSFPLEHRWCFFYLECGCRGCLYSQLCSQLKFPLLREAFPLHLGSRILPPPPQPPLPAAASPYFHLVIS